MGLDVCEIARMEKLLADERFLKRYFTEEEQQYIHNKGKAAAESMAGMYAAKEAFVKAVGVGISLPLRDVAIAHTPLGQPCYRLQGKAAEFGANDDFLLSITHDAGVAAAVCLWQK